MNATKFYESALLAEASYANLQNIITKDDLITALQRIGTEKGDASILEHNGDNYAKEGERRKKGTHLF